MGSMAKPFMHEVIEGKVCVSQNVKPFAHTLKFRCFLPQSVLVYQPFCDDFGPFNLSSVIKFIEMLDREISQAGPAKVVYCVDPGPRALANAVFLLGAYMVLRLGTETKAVLEKFEWLEEGLVEPFRDATYSTCDFGLTIQDCLEGLERGKAIGWIQPESQSGQWGMIDIFEYAHYDDSLNGDMHKVIPDKFVAFRGPVDLKGKDYRDVDGFRQFSPAYYIDIFRDLRVSTVIRLNEAQYEPSDFSIHGIQHFDLEFEDCSVPSPDVVKAFFRIVDAAPGLVAVHCKAGLGRTGTLIALYMMRSCGFTPREAIGWLRILRPGAVIGQQQYYLTSCAAAVLKQLAPAAAPAPADPRKRTLVLRTPPHSPCLAPSPPSTPPPTLRRCESLHHLAAAQRTLALPRLHRAASAKELARQVAEGMVRRGRTSACTDCADTDKDEQACSPRAVDEGGDAASACTPTGKQADLLPLHVPVKPPHAAGQGCEGEFFPDPATAAPELRF